LHKGLQARKFLQLANPGARNYAEKSKDEGVSSTGEPWGVFLLGLGVLELEINQIKSNKFPKNHIKLIGPFRIQW
jgi:hypothetical protein